MTKKEYILKVLDKASPYWEGAILMKEQVLSETITPERIEEIYQKCVRAVNETLKQQNQNKAQQLARYLANLQEQEKLSKEADQRDIENLERILESF